MKFSLALAIATTFVATTALATPANTYLSAQAAPGVHFSKLVHTNDPVVWVSLSLKSRNGNVNTVSGYATSDLSSNGRKDSPGINQIAPMYIDSINTRSPLTASFTISGFPSDTNVYYTCSKTIPMDTISGANYTLLLAGLTSGSCGITQ